MILGFLRRDSRQGQGIIEFIVALGILIIVLGGSSIAIIGTLSASGKVDSYVEALGYANEGIEAVKTLKKNSWEDLTNGTHGLDDSGNVWSFSGVSEELDSKYSRTITVENGNIAGDTSEEIKKITSTVEWPGKGGESYSVENEIYLSNWELSRAMVPGGPAYGTCNDFCQSIGYAEGDCWAFPLFCWLYGRDYVPYGCQFCLGGLWDDTCCCW